VDVSRHWLVPRPRFLQRLNPMLLAGTGAALALVAILPGCIDLTNVFDAKGPDFLFFYIVSFAVALAASFILPALVKGRAEAMPVVEVSDPYEVAFLGGGGPRAVDAAFASLFERGAIEFKQQKNGEAKVKQSSAGNLTGLHELEKVVYHSGVSQHPQGT
jgi:hypothetical protein